MKSIVTAISFRRRQFNNALALALFLWAATAVWSQNGQFKPSMGEDELDWADPLNRGLVGYWLSNEGGGNIVNDLSGNGKHGTITGATWTAGKFGPGLLFDGADDQVVIVDTFNHLAPSGELSVSVWVKPISFPASDVYLIFGSDPSSWQISAYLAAGGTELDWSWTCRDAAITVGGHPVGSYKMGTWFHIVGTYDNAYDRIYIDGVLVASMASADRPAIGNGNIYIGGTATSRFSNCAVDNCSIFNRVLTAAEIARLYREQYAGFVADRSELYVTAGGEPPAARHRIIIVSKAALPGLIPVFVIGSMVVACRRRKAA
jgi:hypothetical protein